MKIEEAIAEERRRGGKEIRWTMYSSHWTNAIGSIYLDRDGWEPTTPAPKREIRFCVIHNLVMPCFTAGGFQPNVVCQFKTFVEK